MITEDYVSFETAKLLKEKEEEENTVMMFLQDFYNAHHFDYRGLIPMGLALEAPEGMYKND